MKGIFLPFGSRTMSVMLYRGLLRGRTSGREETKTHTRALQEAIRIRPAIKGCLLDTLLVTPSEGGPSLQERLLRSDVEPKVDDVAILHHIILSLCFQQSFFFS